VNPDRAVDIIEEILDEFFQEVPPEETDTEDLAEALFTQMKKRGVL